MNWKQWKTLYQIWAQYRSKLIKKGTLHYHFNVKLLPGNQFQTATDAVFHLKNSDNLFFDYAGKEVNQIIANGKLFSNPSQYFNGHFIYIDKEYLLEGENKIFIRCKSQYNKDGNGCVSYQDVDKNQYIYTQFQSYYANLTFALFDQPDLKATFKMNVIHPKEWVVLSNQSHYKNGQKYDEIEFLKTIRSEYGESIKKMMEGCSGQNFSYSIFPTSMLMSCYLYCFIAGPYVKIECKNPFKVFHYHQGMQMSLYSIASMKKYLQKHSEFIFQTSIETLKFYEMFFQRPYAFNKLEQVFVHEYKWGAMQNTGIVTYNDLFLYKQEVPQSKMFRLANLISHELSHHWFGNLVTMNWWDDLWLNQSFAEFISHFCLSKIMPQFKSYPSKIAMLQFNYNKGQGYQKDQMKTTHPITGVIENTLVAQSIFDGITYQKGAAVLKQLLFIIGEQNFSQALRTYFNKYAFSNASLKDFINQVGVYFYGYNFSIQDWQHEWLQTAGLNSLLPEWNPDTISENAEMIIHQKATLPQFCTMRRFKLKGAFIDANCHLYPVDIFVENKEQTVFTYDATKKYEAFFLNYQDQAFCLLKLDKASIEFFKMNITKVDCTLSKCLIWRSIYEMVKNAEISASDYLTMFINSIQKETDLLFIENQYSFVLQVINSCVPKIHRDSFKINIFDMTLKMLESQKENKNKLVILKSNILNFACTKQQFEILIQWYDNKKDSLSHVKLELTQQWHCITVIHNTNLIDLQTKKNYFEKQAAIDNSNTKVSLQKMYRVMTCTDDEYHKVFQQIVSMKETSLTSSTAIMNGFSSKVNAQRWLKFQNRCIEQILQLSKRKEYDYGKLYVLHMICLHNDNLQEIRNLLKVNLQEVKKNQYIIGLHAQETIENIDKRMKCYAKFIQKKQ